MLYQYYCVDNPLSLKKYIDSYIPLVLTVAQNFKIDLTDSRFSGDHLGLQVLSAEEFDKVDKLLLSYSNLIHDNVIHERRNRVYQFNQPIESSGVNIKSIEIFEPKPNADLKKLKPGIEHIAFVAGEFDKVANHFKSNLLPVDKFVEYPNGEKFFKTSLVNMVEIEFRNGFLGLQ